MTTTCAGARATDRFEHQAVFYRGLDELVSSVVPFVREGVERGESVLLALLPDRLEIVEAALGADSTRVDFVDMGELGANPACILPEWRRFLDDAEAEAGVRGVAEPLWSGRRAAELEEVALHENLLNVAFGEGPAWQLMCPHDVDTLPADVIEEARRSHPVARGALITGEYAGPARAHERFSSPLSGAPDDARRIDFGPEGLTDLRLAVTELADRAGVNADRRDDLVLAAHELATNSVVHGGGSGVLRAWPEPGALVVEVTDAGVIQDPLVGRDVLHDFAENGRGIWMANQLCDLVQVRSGATGTVVRLHAWL